MEYEYGGMTCSSEALVLVIAFRTVWTMLHKRQDASSYSVCCGCSNSSGSLYFLDMVIIINTEKYCVKFRKTGKKPKNIELQF